MHDSLTILGGFLLYGREFPPMEDRRSEGELAGNIFRQHHRGIVRMKFSRSGSTRLRIQR